MHGREKSDDIACASARKYSKMKTFFMSGESNNNVPLEALGGLAIACSVKEERGQCAEVKKWSLSDSAVKRFMSANLRIITHNSDILDYNLFMIRIAKSKLISK